MAVVLYFHIDSRHFPTCRFITRITYRCKLIGIFSFAAGGNLHSALTISLTTIALLTHQSNYQNGDV